MVRLALVQISLPKKIAFALLPALALLVVAEIGARYTGAGTRCSNPWYAPAMWACDPVLFFKLQPTLIVDQNTLNTQGFRSREFEWSRKPNTVRVLSLGDSCTFGMVHGNPPKYVPKPYPQRLEDVAAERIGPNRVEALNAAVPGYNSFHGVMLLRTKLRGLRPDVITVRYGWNDHFISQGDAGTFREVQNPAARAVEDVLLRTQLYPFALRLGLALRVKLGAYGKPAQAEIPREWKPTVPVEEYKHNLRRIVELGRAEGARVWLLTSPHAFLTMENAGRESGPNEWTERRVLTWNALPSFERLIEIHEEYNRATREVGAEVGAPVIDMYEVYKRHADQSLFTSDDVCHPLQAGHDLEAETLYEMLQSEGLTSIGH